MATKTYYEQNREKCIAAAKAWYARNRESVLLRLAKRYQENRKLYIERSQTYYRATLPQRRVYHAAYRSANKDTRRVNQAARRVRKRSIPGRCTPAQWRALVDFFGPDCLACGQAEPLTMDHIVPITLPGASGDPSNLQPLCGPCNSSKGATYYDHRGPYIWRGMLRLGWLQIT